MKILFCLPFIILACSSSPTVSNTSMGPPWTRESTRVVDNGYIVYVGHAEASQLDTAQFKAEGIALEDLANECSIIPKGTRIEDRYTESIRTGHSAYVKVALEMQDCEHAVKTTDPTEIKRIANVAFTGQLKKFQDLNETGALNDEPDRSVALDIPPPPEQGKTSDEVHFYVTRQYIARQNEIVILAPPTAFAPGSPESVSYLNTVRPATEHVAGMVQKDPGLALHPTPWSKLPNRPHVVPSSHAGPHAIHPPTAPLESKSGRQGMGHSGHRHRR